MNFDATKPFPQVVREGGSVSHLYKFTTLDELQDAMASLVKVANGLRTVPEWIFLPCEGKCMSDPLGQAGYVGFRFKEAQP